MQNTTTQSDKKWHVSSQNRHFLFAFQVKKTLLLKAVNVDLSTEESVTSQTP